MNSTNLFAVHFLARPIKVLPHEAMIFVRISVGRNRLELSLRKRIPLEYWDAKSGCIKGHKKLMQELNPYLSDIRYQLMECVRQLNQEKRKLTPEAIKRRFLGEEIDWTLCGLMTYHNENLKTVLAPGTLKNYFTTERYVRQFLKQKHGTNDILLAELNFQFITEFEIFLRKAPPLMENNPLTNNGIMKHMERLRKMVTLAAKMEWIPKDPFLRYSLKFQKVDKPFLSSEELKRVEETELPLQKLYLARDLFVFSCYTGLAYVDLVNLQPGNLCIGSDEEFWIRTSRRKTETSVNVPLLPKAKVILEKYRHDPRAMNRGHLFPTLCNQKMNEYLKQIAAVCSILKPFSFHTARHTFATTVTLANGVPLETVSKMLGHTKLSTTQIYARVLENKISDDMRALRQKL